jgi:hypothetical protein
MHDVLRQRLVRKIESLPDEQIYQILDYIEFLEAKYASTVNVEASGLQKFAEGLEDKLRRRAVSPSTIREAFQLISAADRVLSGVSSAGRQILSDLNTALEVDDDPGAEVDDARTIQADPRKRRPSGPSRRPSGLPPSGSSETSDPGGSDGSRDGSS